MKYCVFFILIALTLTGCGEKEEVTEYEVSKENEHAAVPSGMEMPSLGQAKIPQSTIPGLEEVTEQFTVPSWDVPKEWVAQSLGSMRKGSFLIEGEGDQSAEISVLAFPGDVGGLVPNINRWRQQIGLGDMSQVDIEGLQETLVDGLKATMVDFSGSGDSSKAVYGAIVPADLGTWYFKMMGDSPIVEGQKEAFDRFLKSVKF